DGQFHLAAIVMKARASPEQPREALGAGEPAGGDHAQGVALCRKRNGGESLQIDPMINQMRFFSGGSRQPREQTLHRGAIAKRCKRERLENCWEMSVIVFHLVRMDADAEGNTC